MAGTVHTVVNGGAVVRASEEQQSTIDETRGGSLVSLLQALVEERVAAGFNRYTRDLVCILGNTQGQAKMAVYVSRKRKVEGNLHVESVPVCVNLIKARLLVDLNFYRTAGQRSRRPDGSHSNDEKRACKGSCMIRFANLHVKCSYTADRVLRGNPMILEHTVAVLCRRFLFWMLVEWNQQVMEKVMMLSMKE
ncbi:hypothetical protein F2P81_023405 [Scophthalmus maximus]|uniref:Uncharacterized protein n=1 Tax=Scophthalmus maximus TaxID=52904 RepID=A0A6A4RRF0_SCOMX|nr:hypothetical protein F2P81_023405 [Scophthalmus maximus]